MEIVSNSRAIPSIRRGFFVIIWNFETASPGIEFQRKTLIPDNSEKVCSLIFRSELTTPIPCPVVAKLVILIGLAGIAILDSFLVIVFSIYR